MSESGNTEGLYRARSLLMCLVAVTVVLGPRSAGASHEVVQGRIGMRGTLGVLCADTPACAAFLASGCPGDHQVYKDDLNPFISVRKVESFTAKDRTAVFRVVASQWPAAVFGELTLVVVSIKTCDLDVRPAHSFVDLQLGASERIPIPKGTIWVAVYQRIFGDHLNDQWKLTFDHLSS